MSALIRPVFWFWLGVTLLLSACVAESSPPPDGDVETREILPFHGELRFTVADALDGEGVGHAVMQVANLPIEELNEEGTAVADEDGRIVVHQLGGGLTYRGEGPPEPTFAFSAQGYETRVLSVEDLVVDTTYDPYRTGGLPTTVYTHEKGDEEEVAVFEFVVQLTPLADTEPDKGRSQISLEEALSLLEQATSPAAEAEAFDLIWRASGSLGFSAFDEDNNQVPVSSADFPEKVDHIRLGVDGQAVEHDVIEPENIFILMRE